MIQFLLNNLLWSEGWLLVVIVALIACSGIFLSRYIVLFSFVCFVFFLFFFRNPERINPEALADEHAIICPADGVVVELQENVAGTAFGFAEPVNKIAIFLSVLDVHVNWVPVTGIVEKITYCPGKFLVAFADKSSKDNECNEIYIRTTDDFKIVVRQIAGFIARRISCWLVEGQSVQAGNRLGMIKFGSRVEVIMPAVAQCAVHVQQRVYGGLTILARLPANSKHF